MFTIKLRGTDGSEVIHGGFDSVKFELIEGSPTLKAWVGDRLTGLPMTFDYAGLPRSGGYQPIVWVMNDQGATVAKYEL